jgi:hypothetical protein
MTSSTEQAQFARRAEEHPRKQGSEREPFGPLTARVRLGRVGLKPYTA